MTTAIPEGVSEAALTAAVDALIDLLGVDRVVRGEGLEEFRDPYEPPAWELFVSSAVLLPTTVEHVQEIVRIANVYGIPLWTHGQGRNNAYGGAAPASRVRSRSASAT